MTAAPRDPAVGALQFRAKAPRSHVPADRANRLRHVRRWIADSSWSRRWATAALVPVIVAAATIAYLPYTRTPPVKPATAPATVFSAERAMTQLRAVAGEPRPMGSPAHDAAITTIRGRLAELGIESEVVEGIATRNDFNQVFAGRLRNVIARIPGTANGGAVALFSHFNSVPASMNANDGGLGVATLLETVRAIKAGPPLPNDLVLWFGDADETTGLNALVLQEHPWFEEIRFGFAFEATGVSGPSILSFAGQGNPVAKSPLAALGADQAVAFDTSSLSTDNRWLREALRAVPHAPVLVAANDIALGASPDLGMSMWGTDIAGVSFSQVGNGAGYHTRLDRPDRVSLASLQDSGNAALALTRHFGSFDFREAPTGSGVVALTVAPGRTVTYPFAAAPWLALAAVAAFVALVVVGRRRGRLTVTGLAVGATLTLLGVTVAALVAMLTAAALAPEVHFARNPTSFGWRILLLASLTLSVVAALFQGAVRLAKRPARVRGVTAGPLVVLTVLAVVSAVLAPALSYVFVWPSIAAVALLGWQVLRSDDTAEWPSVVALAVLGAVVVVVGGPVVYLLASAASLAVPMFAAVIAVFVALLGSALAPLFRHVSGRRLWLAPTALAVVAAFCATGVQTSGGFSSNQPRPDYIQYTLDADTGRANWLSAGTRTDAWTEQFFTDGYTSSKQAFSTGGFFGQAFDVIEAPAPATALPPPRLTVIDDTTTAGLRSLRLQLSSPRGAAAAHLDLRLPGDLVRAAVGGRTVKLDPSLPQRRFPLSTYNLGPDGMEVTLSVRSTAPITGTLTDYSNGLPQLEGFAIRSRPANVMPAPFDFRDPTAVRTSIEL